MIKGLNYKTEKALYAFLTGLIALYCFCGIAFLAPEAKPAGGKTPIVYEQFNYASAKKGANPPSRATETLDHE